MRYDKLIIMDDHKRKEWEDMDPALRKNVMNNLKHFTEEMEASISIQLLSNVIVDLNNRICDLENKIFQEGKNGSNRNKEG